ncbi:MAG: 3-keto-disaccharide hydrolase [Agriterribacter sp.]
MKACKLSFFISCIALFSCLFANAQKWENLFNGKDLTGWHTIPGGEWKVQKGVIAGISAASEPKHGLLVSDKSYQDFEIEIEYKAVKGNSGLYFRCEEVKDAVGVFGFQAEIDPDKDAGGLYETGGRDWVVQPSAEDVKKWYKPGTWNTMKVRAVGKDITVWVNGIQSAHLTNDPGRTAGHIALQLHGGMDMEVYFRKVRIKIL